MSTDISTSLSHAGDGQYEKELKTFHGVPEVLPVYMTSVFAFDDAGSVEDIYEGKANGYVYARMRHPNSDAAAKALAEADGAESALVFASGMAAIIISILSVVRPGDHILSSPVLYGNVRDYLENELKRFGVETTFVDFSDPDRVESAVRPNTRLLPCIIMKRAFCICWKTACDKEIFVLWRKQKKRR